jgi:hypothetical protein
MANPKGECNFTALTQWIASKKDTNGRVRLNADQKPDLTVVQGYLIYDGRFARMILNRSRIAKELGFYGPGVFKGQRFKDALETFERELGLDPTYDSPGGTMPPASTAAQEEINRLKEIISRQEETILLNEKNLDEVRKTIQQQASQLEQFKEIWRIQFLTGANIPGIDILSKDTEGAA